jgi:hypothetical protein
MCKIVDVQNRVHLTKLTILLEMVETRHLELAEETHLRKITDRQRPSWQVAL